MTQNTYAQLQQFLQPFSVWDATTNQLRGTVPRDLANHARFGYFSAADEQALEAICIKAREEGVTNIMISAPPFVDVRFWQLAHNLGFESVQIVDNDMRMSEEQLQLKAELYQTELKSFTDTFHENLYDQLGFPSEVEMVSNGAAPADAQDNHHSEPT